MDLDKEIKKLQQQGEIAQAATNMISNLSSDLVAEIELTKSLGVEIKFLKEYNNRVLQENMHLKNELLKRKKANGRT